MADRIGQTDGESQTTTQTTTDGERRRRIDGQADRQTGTQANKQTDTIDENRADRHTPTDNTWATNHTECVTNSSLAGSEPYNGTDRP